MDIFLDTRDLIGITERGLPKPLAEIREYLTRRADRLVYTFSNIREIVAPLASRAPFIEMRTTLQALESLPHTYIREPQIVPLEIREAVSAFAENREFALPDIRVNRWDKTLSPMPDGRTSGIEMLVNLRLDELVYMTYKTAPHLFAAPAHHLPELRRLMAADRDLIRASSAPSREEHFKRALLKHAATHRIAPPEGRETELAEWVYENPSRCPGIRFNHELFRELLSNLNDIPETADFSDFGHTFAVPYVDAMTLDRRIRHYCRVASRRIIDAGGLTDLSDRIHPDLSTIMGKFPTE